MDAHYVIGSGHLACQDYALSGENYTIISDGCSSALYSDVGARILAHRAAHVIKYFNDDVLFEPDRFGRAVIKSARSIIDELDIPVSALDATLGVVFEIEGMVYVYLFGDGCIYIKYTDGSSQQYIVEYPMEKPFYLSYKLSSSSEEEYISEVKTKSCKYIHTDRDSIPLVRTQTDGADEVFIISADVSEISQVVIFSDGIETYYNNNEFNRLVAIPSNSLIKEITTFNNSSPGFVQRRLKRMEKDFAKRNIVHYDDLSMGAIQWVRD
ncbi:MAG TPA: protein phosphatase 2C domain-containing protein [Bacteroidales bacterium]|nr:protein phosphatase 2C domain-containing protein [Bacteroidales bacterium]